jgi:hypothetical protein
MADDGGPFLVRHIGMPGRMVGGGNFRLWPGSGPETFLRTIGHNAPLRVISSVEGDDGEEWYHVNLLNEGGFDAIADGYLHNSVVRLPRGLQATSPDRADMSGRWIQADLKDPAIVVAYQDGAPIWSTMAIKGVATFKTPLGFHRIVRRVANETMSSETLYPPIPRDSAGGYYVKNVLFTQYFSWGGESIHYNYWSSNFGYAGSHGCLGMNYADSKFMWDWADIGTPVHVFA